MFRLSNLLYLFLCLTFLQSCDTLQSISSVNFEIIIPGKINIPAKYRKAAIRYNNSNVARNSNFSSFFEDNEKIKDNTNIDSMASEVYYQIFTSYLKSQQFFDTIIELQPLNYSDIKVNDSLVYAQFETDNTIDSLQPIVANSEVFSFTKLINDFSDSDSKKSKTKFLDPEFGLYTKEEIQQIADSTKADLLFSLDWFASIDGIFSPRYTMNSPGTINNEDIIKHNSQTVKEVVNIISHWNFYDLKKQELIYSYRKTDTIKWIKPASSLEEAKRILPPRKDAILNAADIAASRFIEFLVPHWIEVERIYYKSGQIDMKKTEALIEENRWLEAAEIWKKNTTNKNKSIAAKSMFNLALACEMNGNMAAAIDWAVKSFYVFGTKNEFHAENCKNYIQILARRKIDIQNIEKMTLY